MNSLACWNGFLINSDRMIYFELLASITFSHVTSIGISIHNIRASQSYIKGTNGMRLDLACSRSCSLAGTSNGLVPMLRVFNDTARYVDQGGGMRTR